MSSITAPEWVSWLAENRLHRLVPLYRFGYISGARSRLGRGALLASACIDPIEEAAIKPSSPQLDEPRRERIEAGLDIALAALRRIAERVSGGAMPGSEIEAARKALARIEALLPETVQQR